MKAAVRALHGQPNWSFSGLICAPLNMTCTLKGCISCNIAVPYFGNCEVLSAADCGAALDLAEGISWVRTSGM